MKKSKIIKSVIAFLGISLFSIGMCATLLPNVKLNIPGNIVGFVGFIILAGLIFYNYITEKDKHLTEQIKVNHKLVISIIIATTGIIFSFIGVKNIVTNKTTAFLILGIISIVIGQVILLLGVPIYNYFKLTNIKPIKIESIKHYSIVNLILLFAIYSFLGWCIEFVFCGIATGVFAKRGILHTTLLPIYGFGGILVTLIFSKNQKFIFPKSLVLLSFLEYITSFGLEFIFKQRWWDYSKNFLNLNGRICLLNSLMFGVAGFAISKYVSPYLNEKLNKININKKIKVAIIFCVVFGIDTIWTWFVAPNSGIGITYY